MLEHEPLDTVHIFSEVLLIEDDTSHARLIQRALRGVVGEVHHVPTARDAIEALLTSMPELILCDMNLPDSTAIALLAQIRSLRPGLPTIILTSSSDIDTAVSAMREGAWDYMVKQFTDDLVDRFKLLITRVAERKLQQIREAQVRAERDAFWAATATAQDGLAILGSSGSVVFENAAFSKFWELLVGERQEQLEGRATLIDALAKLDFREALALREQLQSSGAESLWSTEVKLPVPGEKDFYYFELALSSVQITSLEKLGIDRAILPNLRKFVVWVRDITRKKEQERFQRDLLSTTSHDLKGPLGAILSSAELITQMDALERDKTIEFVTRMASCARSCITLIDELLSARRIQDGVLVIKPTLDNVDEVLEDIVLDFVPSAKAKNIELFARPGVEVRSVYADRLGLRRILTNLVSNAIKFTPKGGKVELSAEQSAYETSIIVSDSGHGIEAKDRHLLFEKYGRLDKHRAIDGTGLGLYVARNIVDAHGGNIEVRSEVGVGTTFIVTLPLPSEKAAGAC